MADGNANILDQLSKETKMNENIKRNIVVLTCGLTLAVASYVGTMDLQSSINFSHNLGTISLSINYSCGLLLSVFATPLLLCNLGAKWTLILGEIGFTTFTFANFYSGLATMVPGSIICSMGEAFVWPAGLLYINHSFINHQRKTVETKRLDDSVKNLWFGLYYAVGSSCVIWGNLLAYAVLYGARKLDVNAASNSTFYDYQTCGANFCKVTKLLEKNMHKYVPKSKTSLYILLAVYAGIQICAILFHIFCLPALKRTADLEPRTRFRCSTMTTTLKSFANHLSSTDQLLMTPICFYYGFLISFSFTDFSRAFVSCTMGVQQVGLVMAVYGVANSIFAFLTGKIAQKLDLPFIYLIRTAMDLFTFIALLVFRPTHASRYWAYGFSVLLGSSDGTWQPIIAVTIALYFPDRTELAFGAITLWKVLAMAVGFVMSGRMCLSIRIYLIIGNLVLAWFCSAVAEKRRRTRTAEEAIRLTAAVEHK